MNENGYVTWLQVASLPRGMVRRKLFVSKCEGFFPLPVARNLLGSGARRSKLECPSSKLEWPRTVFVPKFLPNGIFG